MSFGRSIEERAKDRPKNMGQTMPWRGIFAAIMHGLARPRQADRQDWQKTVDNTSHTLQHGNAKGWEEDYKTTAEVNNDATSKIYFRAFRLETQSRKVIGLRPRQRRRNRRIAGQEDSPNTGGDSTAPRNFEEGPSGDKGYQVNNECPWRDDPWRKCEDCQNGCAKKAKSSRNRSEPFTMSVLALWKCATRS